jgi:hypothetical protein
MDEHRAGLQGSGQTGSGLLTISSGCNDFRKYRSFGAITVPIENHSRSGPPFGLSRGRTLPVFIAALISFPISFAAARVGSAARWA